MTDETPWFIDIPLPALLRHARRTYGAAMRRALDTAGYDDLPGNGLYVIGSLARTETPLAQVVEELGVSKQAAGQLVDTLVQRGYLTREIDPADRRRLTVTLTERGRAAAEAQEAARQEVDADLVARVGPKNVMSARLALATLIGIGREMRADEAWLR
ncbi:MAG: MarR family transcriptional regulator [Alphaproteobacteria bacterium]